MGASGGQAMCKRFWALCLWWLWFTTFTTVSSRAAETEDEPNLDDGRKVALVVGNQAYEFASLLPQAPRDASRVANTLEELGYEVIYVEDATRAQFLRAIGEYRDELEGADVSFFYYAGHAIQVAGVNYLVPVDAKLTSPSDVESEAINANGLVRRVSGAEAPLNVVVLDSCRNNPFAEKWTSARRAIDAVGGLSSMAQDTGVLLAFSTAPDDVAEDSGVYASALVGQLVRSCLTLPQAFARVHDAVVRDTDDRQRPWLNMGIGNIAYRYHPAGCDEARCTVSALQQVTERAESAFGSDDREDFDLVYPVVGRKLACLDRPLPPEVVARVHASAALKELRNFSPDRAEGYLAAMQRADETYGLPNERTGPDRELSDLSPPGKPSLARLPEPSEGSLRIDGKPSNRAPRDQPFVVQLIKDKDSAVFTSLVPVGGELPPYPRKPFQPPRRLRRAGVPLVLGGLASLAVAAATDTASRRQAIGDDLAAARRLRTVNNVTYITGWGAIGAGLGSITASFVVRQR